MPSDYQVVRDHRKMESAGDITIEPMKPKNAPESRSESIAPPDKLGMPKASIGSLGTPNPNKHVTDKSAHPSDIFRPAYTGTVRT